ncbi:hypothetical protein BMS3Bbin08_02357 [bacterium BMS3Bbin08]|nr:hypothetical protein BMS3Bbin08_02357 [bacterium BMS3Bbin08]
MKMKQHFDKKRYNIILHDRLYLTDYEKYQLIPELKSRLKVLKKYHEEVVQLCDIQKKQPAFNQNLNSIINPQGIPSPPEESDLGLSDKYFNDVKKQAKDGVDDIDRINELYENIEDTKQLGMFLNEVNFLCSSLLAVNNRLFLYKINGYPIVTNIQTGQTIATQPPQFYLTTEPFQLLVSNIVEVARATSDSIHEWHKYTMKLKTQYLDLYINRISIRNTKKMLYIQICTILLAISLSAYFLFANDPFNLFRKNLELKKEIVQLKEETDQLKKENKILKTKKQKNLTK